VEYAFGMHCIRNALHSECIAFLFSPTGVDAITENKKQNRFILSMLSVAFVY
jgi:hypothetical protein